MTRDWLRSRGNSIEGGTSEIQLNIIAKRVLGLAGLTLEHDRALMDLVLNEEQELLARTAREFVSRALVAAVASAQLRDSERRRRLLARALARDGGARLARHRHPEEHGGAGLGYMDQMVVLEEMGRGLMPGAVPLDRCSLGATALLLGGSAAQKKDAPAEGRGRRARCSRSRTRRRGSRYDVDQGRDQGDQERQRLDAQRREDPGARRPRRRLPDRAARAPRVRAPTRSGVHALFLVAADTPGVTIERQSRIDGRNVALVRFDDVRVDADAVVGDGRRRRRPARAA